MSNKDFKPTPIQEAIMLSSIIGSIMGNYNPKIASERLKPIMEIKRRIKKFMIAQSRRDYKSFHEAIMYTDAIWRESVDHFAKQKLTIESVSTIIRLYDVYSNELSRYANLHEKQMEKFAINQSDEVTKEIEMTSYLVSDYILDKIAFYTGKNRRKLNLKKVA